MKLKDIVYKIFGVQCKTVADFYALKFKLINWSLSCPLGRLFNIAASPKDNLTVLLYPSVFKLTSLSSKKVDPSWTGSTTVFDYKEDDGFPQSVMRHQLEAFSKWNISKESIIMDVGCSGGWYLRKLNDMGWKNLIGVEPSKVASEHLKINKSIKVYNEFFGYGEHLKEKVDVCCFNDSIDRIPYGGSFSALNVINPKFISIKTRAFCENYPRDWHLEMSKLKYFCVQKDCYIKEPDGNLSPVFDLTEIDIVNTSIHAHYLFTKIPD